MIKKLIITAALLVATPCYAEPTKTPDVRVEFKFMYINKPFVLRGDPYKFIEFVQTNQLIFDVVGYVGASPIVVILDQEELP